MSKETSDYILGGIRNDITGQANFKVWVSPEEKLNFSRIRISAPITDLKQTCLVGRHIRSDRTSLNRIFHFRCRHFHYDISFCFSSDSPSTSDQEKYGSTDN